MVVLKFTEMRRDEDETVQEQNVQGLESLPKAWNRLSSPSDPRQPILGPLIPLLGSCLGGA